MRVETWMKFEGVIFLCKVLAFVAIFLAYHNSHMANFFILMGMGFLLLSMILWRFMIEIKKEEREDEPENGEVN